MTESGKRDTGPPAPALQPGLHVVATPIGNLRDITLRALDTLRSADVIACEDTRVSGRLLAAYDIETPLTAYHDHNAETAGPVLVDRLGRGGRIALISDAGTPLISDPGYRLIRRAREAGIDVYTVPGPSAAIAALAIAGLPTDRFLFAGFLPAKPGARSRALKDMAEVPATLVFFESANRLAGTLAALAEALGDRPAAIGRELTKRYEDMRHGRLTALAEEIRDRPVKGEVVILVAPPGPAGEPDEATIDAELARRLETEGTKQAANAVAEAFGLSKKRVYDRALRLKDGERI